MTTCPLDTLPRIVLADDYHELHNLPEDVHKWLGIKVNCRELGFDGLYIYIGIVYQGKLPAKNVIAAMLRKQKIVLEERNK